MEGMAARRQKELVRIGAPAPAFRLPRLEGGEVSLKDLIANGPVVLAFFKVSCPVCQFTFPFLERLHETYGSAGFTVFGISQDDARDTREFAKEFGVKFPVLIDERGYPASNHYGLTNVPSVFLISPDGKIKISSVGFSRADLEKISGEAARAAGKPAQPLFRPGEVVPDYKPG